MRDIVVVGASAGGVAALRGLAAALPPNYPGAIFVVLHTSPAGTSIIGELMSRAGPLRAAPAEDGEPIVAGRVYVSRADHHLLVERRLVSVTRGPRENRHRPAIDPLFRSAAWAYGPHVIGIVLSGTLDDGTAGLWAIKSCGGITVVQEPNEAQFPEMPMNALQHNQVDHRLPLYEIAQLISRLAEEPLAALPLMPAPAQLKSEIEYARASASLLSGGPPPGSPSPFTCPSCGGALWELEEGGHLRYRCHTGHAYASQELLAGQTESAEQSLFHAVRVMQEKSAALRRLATYAGRQPLLKHDYEERAQALDASSEVLRRLLGRPLA